MTRPQLSARNRLTALYTALVACCGAILVTATYLLLVHNLPAVTAQSKTAGRATDPQFIAACAKLKQDAAPDANLTAKCTLVFQQGVQAGAQAQRNTTAEHLLIYSVVTLAAVTVLAAALGWILAGRILRPVKTLTAAAKTASEHNLSHRLNLTGPRDELRELADTFDDMLDRLNVAFTSQRRFIANASHELRTPLTVMRTTIDVVQAKAAATPEQLTAMGTDVRHAVEHAEALIDALLTLAQNERGLTVHETVDLATATQDVLESTAAENLTVEADLESTTVTGDPILLERLVANLVDNAVRYNIPDGRITISTCHTDETALLRISNTGAVVPPERVESLFEPFARLDQRTGRAGFGLGLALVNSIVTMHNATLTATAPPTGGLAITVRWPKPDTDADGHAPALRSTESGGPFR
jgi:signal transduction histidine kinase